MKYKIFFTDEAKKDLVDIENYSLDKNTSLKYIQNILKRISLIEDFPKIGISIKNHVFEEFSNRYLIVGNHAAYYQINDIAKCVYITGIISTNTDWKIIVNKDIVLPSKIIARNEILKIQTMDVSMYYDVWRNSLDDNNRKFVPDEVFETLEEASLVVDQIIKNYETQDGPFVYAVIRSEDNTNLGYVQLISLGDFWEIGYHIAKKYNDKGYATSAVKLFLNYLEKETNLKDIYGIALSANKASVRVLDKCGFELLYEGNGQYQGNKRKIVKYVKRLSK